MENQLTEDQVVKSLMIWIKKHGWEIIEYCLGHTRGYDIVASKNEKRLIIEAKGFKANNDSPIKKREHFDSGQIKDHLGKAIVKSIETQIKFPNADVAIAHPNNEYLKSICKNTTEYLSQIKIYSFWVNENGTSLSNYNL